MRVVSIGAQEPEEEGLEWELKDWDEDQQRLCSITLVKKAPGNVTVWWPKVLTTDDAIDTTKIEGPNRWHPEFWFVTRNFLSYCWYIGRQSAADGRSVWEEAHRMFKEKISNHTPENIEI